MSLTLHRQALKPGLYLVATPIGNLRDITLRALETLHSVSLIACEDTRVTAKLLRHYGIDTPTDSYHEHNAARMRPKLLEMAKEKAVALVSDAGTPLISDPGYKLVREAAAAGIHVEAIPGASSTLTALCISALPTDQFCFLGFLPAKDGAARKKLESMKNLEATLILFESAKRVAETLVLAHEILGKREAAVARELTKLYEEVQRGTLESLAAHYKNAPEPRGEIVLLIGPAERQETSAEILDNALNDALSRLSVKDAVAEVSASLGLPRNEVYARALELKGRP